MGKLDATMVANGPEDDLGGWDAVDWQAAECLRSLEMTM